MSQFDIMNDVVEEICKSLVEEPHRWEFDACTFKHKFLELLNNYVIKINRFTS